MSEMYKIFDAMRFSLSNPILADSEEHALSMFVNASGRQEHRDGTFFIVCKCSQPSRTMKVGRFTIRWKKHSNEYTVLGAENPREESLKGVNYEYSLIRLSGCCKTGEKTGKFHLENHSAEDSYYSSPEWAAFLVICKYLPKVSVGDKIEIRTKGRFDIFRIEGYFDRKPNIVRIDGGLIP